MPYYNNPPNRHKYLSNFQASSSTNDISFEIHGGLGNRFHTFLMNGLCIFQVRNVSKLYERGYHKC